MDLADLKRNQFRPPRPAQRQYLKKNYLFCTWGAFSTADQLRLQAVWELSVADITPRPYPGLENAKYKIIQEGTNLTNPIPTCKIQRMAKYHKDKFKLMISVQIQIYKYKVEHWQKHSLQNQIMLIVGSHHVFFQTERGLGVTTATGKSAISNQQQENENPPVFCWKQFPGPMMFFLEYDKTQPCSAIFWKLSKKWSVQFSLTVGVGDSRKEQSHPSG